jgi:hypothetical protein
MDTTTVLAIMKMIETRVESISANAPITVHEDGLWCVDDYDQGRINVLTELQDHLQSYIEGQLNALENSTEQ